MKSRVLLSSTMWSRIALLPTLIATLALCSNWHPTVAATAADATLPAAQLISVTVPIPNGKPTAVEVYEAGNVWCVTDNVQGALLAFDATTNQLRATIPIAKGVYPDAFVIDDEYGQAFAASETSLNSEFGRGSGKLYVVDLQANRLIGELDPTPFMSSLSYTLAHDETRHRVYINGTGGLAYVDIASNTLINVPLPDSMDQTFFLVEEMAVNEATNTLYMLQNSYMYERIWILEIGSGAWSYVDFPTMGARDPQHLAISESTNMVFAKVVQMPGNNLPGIFTLDRTSGNHRFSGESDYGPMVVNETSGRLYTGVEVAEVMAIVEMDTSALVHVAMPGATTGIGVRESTDHAFLANQRFVAIVDGASRTSLKAPVNAQPEGGILVQDVAVNQATGWVYAIPDARQPQVIALQDLPQGPVQQLLHLPQVMRD